MLAELSWPDAFVSASQRKMRARRKRHVAQLGAVIVSDLLRQGSQGWSRCARRTAPFRSPTAARPRSPALTIPTLNEESRR